jgi:hypothetical protein
MPPSIALAIAYRLKARILATPRLMRRGTAGEGHAPELDRKGLAALREEVLKLRQRDKLLEIPWQHGLNPEEGCRTARFRVNEAEGTIGVFVGRSRRPVETVPLDEYRDAVQILYRDTSQGRRFHELYRDSRAYRQAFERNGSVIRYSLHPV